MSSANTFKLDWSKILPFGKVLTNQQNFGMVQIESICTRENKCD